MKVEQQTNDGVLILRPVGRLDSVTSNELERVLTENLDAGATRLVFDFVDLDYISSAGLRVVLLAGKKLRATQGKMALIRMSDVVKEVFEMSGFLNLFAVGNTVEEGVAKCA
jgi:anti-anti-sigma factor